LIYLRRRQDVSVPTISLIKVVVVDSLRLLATLRRISLNNTPSDQDSFLGPSRRYPPLWAFILFFNFASLSKTIPCFPSETEKEGCLSILPFSLSYLIPLPQMKQPRRESLFFKSPAASPRQVSSAFPLSPPATLFLRRRLIVRSPPGRSPAQPVFVSSPSSVLFFRLPPVRRQSPLPFTSFHSPLNSPSPITISLSAPFPAGLFCSTSPPSRLRLVLDHDREREPFFLSSVFNRASPSKGY